MFVIAWLLFVHKLTVGYATENISSSGIYKPEGFDVTLYQRFGVRATSPPLLARLSWKFMSSTHSQFEEDKILYAKFFYGYVNGTFIESGALDGKKFSNTWAFEHALGWTGVNIEGSVRNFRGLLQNRPNCVNVHAALCKEGRELTYAESNRLPETNGILEFLPDHHVRKFFLLHRYHSVRHSNGTVEFFGLTPKRVKTSPVHCKPLHLILKEVGMTHIDLWSLDVEGGELEVLQETDFSSITVNVIVVEMHLMSSEQKNQILLILQNAGLTECMTIKISHICWHKNFTPFEKPSLAVAPAGIV